MIKKGHLGGKNAVVSLVNIISKKKKQCQVLGIFQTLHNLPHTEKKEEILMEKKTRKILISAP